jgi:rubrerythrin
VNYQKYSLEDVLLSAIKSERDSNNVYTRIAQQVNNGLLQDKFEFLAKEEEKHRVFIEKIYRKQFPGKTLILPKTTPVPLPEISFTDETTPLSSILQQAMKAELAAREFYQSLSQRFETDDTIKKHVAVLCRYGAAAL